MAAQTEQKILAAVGARRVAGVADLDAELRQRIADLGDLRLDTPERQDAFKEVFAAFTPVQFDLYAMPDVCAIARASSTIQISGVLVDTQNRQRVGPMRRTLVLDVHFVTHDYRALQQFYAITEGGCLQNTCSLRASAALDSTLTFVINVLSRRGSLPRADPPPFR